MTQQQPERRESAPDRAVHDSNESITDVWRSDANATGPETNYDSRKVMLRAERKDTIEIAEIVRPIVITEPPSFDLTLTERTATYFGPELRLAGEDANYLLTAPGPNTHLVLWKEETDERGYRTDWTQLAEVKAKIVEMPQYDICSQCETPIRSAEHERQAKLGQCPYRPRND